MTWTLSGIPSHLAGEVADTLWRLGDSTSCLKITSALLARHRDLALSDPSNMDWQRDLSVSHNRIGDIERVRGDLEAALTAYSASLGIAEQLIVADPSNMEWQRDLIISNVKLAELDNEPAARYGAALEVAKSMKASGILNPADEWMLDALKKRLDAAG